MLSLLTIATTVCIGLMTGVEFAMSAFVNPVLWKLDDAAQARAIRMFAANLGRVMPIWYGAGLLFLLAEAVLLRHHPSAALLDAASGIWALTIVQSILFLVPINNRMAAMETAEFSEVARREHRKWDWMHRVRIGALIAAMICFLAGVCL